MPGLPRHREEAARRRGAIMAGQCGYQLAEQRKCLGFTQAGLAEIMGSGPLPSRLPLATARFAIMFITVQSRPGAWVGYPLPVRLWVS
jgi:hypothetical protein